MRIIKKRPFLLRKPVLIAVILLIAGAVFAVLELSNTTHIFHKNKPVAQVTGGAATKGQQADPRDPSTEDSDTTPEDVKGSDTSDDKSPLGGAPDAKLLSPKGPFVSNHFPNLSGRPAPNTINSVCNTTPGAKCQIVFTKGSTTKSLPAQLTDRGGATYWNGWKVQSIGLTSGEWVITAKATLGSQVKMSTDALSLKVSP